MAVIRSILAWPMIVISTMIIGTLTLFLHWIPPRGRWWWAGVRAWGRAFLALGGVRSDASGPPLPDGPFVFVANHESLLDIPVLLARLPEGARFFAKAVLFRLPWVGWNMRLAGFFPVDRSDRRKAIRAIEAAAAGMERGGPVLIFAEETRSPDGILLPFQKGGFLLAMKAGVPIVPVGVGGTRDRLVKGGWRFSPGDVQVRWGEPILTAELHRRDRPALIEETRRAIQTLRGGGARVSRDMAGHPGKEELTLATAGEDVVDASPITAATA